MAKKRRSGLRKRGDFWHIEKYINGQRVYESTGETDSRKAEAYYDNRIKEIREAVVYGTRPAVNFKAAAEKFLREDCPTRSLEPAGYAFDKVLPYIGALPIERVHDGSLAKFRKARQDAGVSVGTINKELGFVRRVLLLAARKWRHPNGMQYLSEAPLIGMIKGSARKPYPLEWQEQARLFAELPGHLERMALFDVNTGLRAKELCELRWSWEIQVPELETSVFLLPETMTKNGEERIVVLNRIARSVVESQRVKHREYVFTYKGAPLARMNNHAWRKARARAGLPRVRVHDLRTFGHRLRAAGVSFEDRQDLLGHRSGRITTHYSAPDLKRLLAAVNLLCNQDRATVLRLAAESPNPNSGKIPAMAIPAKSSALVRSPLSS